MIQSKMKTFKIFKSDSTSEIIQADKAEWWRKKDGLLVKFTTGKTTTKFSAASVLIEIAPEIIIASVKNENEQDD